MWDTGRILKSKVLRAGGPWLFLAVLPVIVHLPALTGAFRFDPIYIVSGLTSGTWTTNGLITGYPGWIDANAGVTTEALGGLAAHLWLQGTLPWWNHYSGVGLPLAAEGQNPAFFLPFVLLLALPHGLLLLRMTLMAIAGLSTFALLRALRLGPMPSLVGAALFELCGVFAWLAHGPMLPAAFLPMLLLGVERARLRHGTLWVALGTAWTLAAGFPETACLDLLFAATWIGWRTTQCGWRFFRRVGFAGLSGAAIAAPAIWPFLEALPRSFVGEHTGAVSQGLAAGNPALLLFPTLYGGLLAGPLLGQNPGGVWSRAGGYVGLVTVILASAAFRLDGSKRFFFEKKNQKTFAHGAFGLGWLAGLLAKVFASSFKKKRFLLAIWIAVTFARACMVLGIIDLFAAIPLLRQVMVHVWVVPTWCLACSILAAFALEDWQTCGGRLLHGASLVALLAAALALILARHDITALWRLLPSYPWFFVGTLAATLIVIAALAALGAAREKPSAGRQLAATALVVGNAACLFAFPLLAGTHGRRLDVASIRFLQDHVGTARVISFGPLVPNYGALYGIAEIGDNYLPVPANWVAYTRARFMPDNNGVNFSYGDVPKPAILHGLLPALEDAGVGYALTWPFEPPLAGVDADPPVLVHHGAVMDIWALPHPAPYWDAPGCSIATTGRDAAAVYCHRPSTLVRRELSWPGWHATLDGQAADIAPTAGIFQAVNVPAGRSEIRFFYAPPGCWAAGMFCLLGLIGVGATLRRSFNQI